MVDVPSQCDIPLPFYPDSTTRSPTQRMSHHHGVEWSPLKRENGLLFPLSFAPIPISCVLTDPTIDRRAAHAASAEDKANFEEA